MNRGFTGILAKKVSREQLFVRLQRPLPVMESFRPGRSFLSNTTVRSPERAENTAAVMPAAPAPIIIVLIGINSVVSG